MNLWLKTFYTAALAAIAVTTVACRPAATPEPPARQVARGAILTLASAVAVADATCASIVRQRQDVALGRTCKAAYDTARPALLGAEEAIDAWDAGQQGNVACTVGQAAESLSLVADALVKVGVSLPAVVIDALALSRGFGEVCHGR